MSVMSRKTVRDHIAAGLTTGAPTAQIVYSGQKKVESSPTPCIRVFSSGSGRPAVPKSGRRSVFLFIVQVWVLLYSSDPGDGWDSDQAEDALDTIEAEIAEWIGDNQLTPDMWTSIEYSGTSFATNVVLTGGLTYIVEDIPIEVRVYG